MALKSTNATSEPHSLVPLHGATRKGHRQTRAGPANGAVCMTPTHDPTGQSAAEAHWDVLKCPPDNSWDSCFESPARPEASFAKPHKTVLCMGGIAQFPPHCPLHGRCHPNTRRSVLHMGDITQYPPQCLQDRTPVSLGYISTTQQGAIQRERTHFSTIRLWLGQAQHDLVGPTSLISRRTSTKSPQAVQSKTPRIVSLALVERLSLCCCV